MIFLEKRIRITPTPIKNIPIKKIPTDKIVATEKERISFKQLILENPNYFNTFPELKINPIKPMQANIKYEELTCIGFYPESDLLEAIIQIKLPTGYNGDLCSSGSFEYVRFFVDWNGDGNFIDEGEDVGIASVNVHDIPDSGHVCIDKSKPIYYALRIKINSKKKFCVLPNLVKVRAILSWNLPPTPGNPNFNPPWGNVVEKWIQIKPGTNESSYILLIKTASLKVEASLNQQRDIKKDYGRQ